MPKRTALTVLAMTSLFLAAQTAPMSAQVMKNFSWKKKSAKTKLDAGQATKPAETDAGQRPAPKRQRANSAN
jgi:hypothetical protein